MTSKIPGNKKCVTSPLYLQQVFILKLEDTIGGNESCMDTINISGALQKLATACCLVPPVGDILVSAQRLFQKLIGLALNLQGTFKIDAINVMLGALARLSNHSARTILPPAGTDEAFSIQVSSISQNFGSVVSKLKSKSIWHFEHIRADNSAKTHLDCLSYAMPRLIFVSMILCCLSISGAFAARSS